MGAEQIRILLVEDNPGDARLLREMLAEPSRETFQLVHVERISEALARLSSDVFDAILLDLSLPDGQGLETVDLICRRVRHIPVVVLTGLDDETLALTALQHGAQDYLIKGHIEPSWLVRALRYAIERHRMWIALQNLALRDAALLEIAHALSSTLELKQLLKLIARRTAHAVSAERCSINLVRDGRLTPVMSQFADGHADPVLWRAFKAMGPSRLEDVAGHAEAIRTKRPVLIEDVLASDLIPAYWITTFGLRAVAVFPLIRNDEVIGTLNLEQTEGPYAWRPEQVDVATLIANQAALAIDNAQLYARVQAQVKELQETQAQLVQAGKLAAVGQLVAGVAHEINNPLTVVAGQAQLLQCTSTDPDVVDRAEKILAGATRAARIIRELQTFARPTPPEQFVVHLSTVIARVLALREQTLHVSGIPVECDLAAEAPPVWGDPSQLEQVVLNLLLNAEHAMMQASGQPPLITLRLTAAGDRVRVAVSDTGPGIPPDVLPRIFEPFFTTKPVGQGTGLGLSICHSIVQAHRGRIWADSPPGQGATVVVELPACPVDATDAAATVRPPVETVRRGHVLVIDDEPAVADTVGAILESLGQDVTVAIGGEAGWARLSAPDALVYDLVTVDFRMPDLPGDKLWQRIRTERPALAKRVVFVTGDTANPDTQRVLADTGRPVLHKPFDQAALAALLPVTPPRSNSSRQ
jgi:signal transduction histidine kinase